MKNYELTNECLEFISKHKFAMANAVDKLFPEWMRTA